MALAIEGTQIKQVINHVDLSAFNKEFGTGPEPSRYAKLDVDQRATSPVVTYLNQLQMDAFISSSTALLLKNNLHDTDFVIDTTHSILYELRKSEKIGDACFDFLHKKVRKKDFQTVFKYLYILMLYDAVSKAHEARNKDPAFRFESLANYSSKLVQAPARTVAQEERALQEQSRKQFIIGYLTEIPQHANYPEEVTDLIPSVIAAINDPAQFRTRFLSLMEQIQDHAPILEEMCWKELQSSLLPFTGPKFFEQTYLRLKTEHYYKNCLARVHLLQQSLSRSLERRTDSDLPRLSKPDLLRLSEKCKKAYNGCIYLLRDCQKNMVTCSPTRFAALIGKMRTEWQAINNIFSIAMNEIAHRLCACQVQIPPTKNELAEWPFSKPSLIPLQPARPVTGQHFEREHIDPVAYQENQKKTVAIIGCKWGGGHMEVSRGISNKLSSIGYHPVTIDLPETMKSEDPVHKVASWFGKDWTVATLFERLLHSKAFATINFLRWIKPKTTSPSGCSENELNIVMKQLLKINPDSVIITYNAHHEPIVEACKILGIPCMLVATDVDTSFEREGPTDHRHFKIAIPFNVAESINPIAETTTEEQQFVSGPPVRHEFTVPRTEADIRQFKEIWGIAQNKKVVVISSGKNGAFSPYAEILAKKYADSALQDIPIHLIVICGKDNTKFKQHLEQNVQPHTKLPMTITLFHNPEEMEQLMSMASDGGVIIGKAGGGTIFECFTRGTRMLIDDVRPGLFSQGFTHFMITCLEMLLRQFGFERQLPWEKVNTDFARQHGIADSFDEHNDFLPKFEAMLEDDTRPDDIEMENVEIEIPRVLGEMLASAAADEETQQTRLVLQNL